MVQIKTDTFNNEIVTKPSKHSINKIVKTSVKYSHNSSSRDKKQSKEQKVIKQDSAHKFGS